MTTTLIEIQHGVCLTGLPQWIDRDITTEYFLWVCNMVHSDNIALVAILEGF